MNNSVIKYSNKIIALLFLCLLGVLMIPRGNLTPWSFNKEKDLYRAESLAKLADSEITALDSKQVFAFDPDWDDVSPFVQGKDGFSLRVNIGSDIRILFPTFLNSGSPIKIRTGNKTVKQYLSSGGSYKGELVGRYLIYRGNGPDILYRFDTDSNELREFVYVPTRSSLNADGEVIRWRFEGVNLSLQKNGSVRLVHSSNPAEKLSQIADSGMQSRISRFLEKRNQPLSNGPVEKTLFVIPRPEYVDGNLKTLTKGIYYEVSNNELKLFINTKMDFSFPLWVDPTLTLRADADADVILDGQSSDDQFGFSVASAGDFNGDGIDDMIVGAYQDEALCGTNCGNVFIFFGGITGTKRADADADVILRGQMNNDFFGFAVASAGDFNGDGKDDVIVGAYGDDNNGSVSGSAFIFFGGITGTINADSGADVILNGQSTGDEFGISVASAGDFNGDGKSDVIVGASEDDNNSETDSGSAFIFFGGVTGTRTADTHADVILNGQSSGDLFGYSVSSAGDFNGDGKDDVIVGARYDDNNSENSSGSAFIFFGGVTGTKRADAHADVILNGQSAGDRFGRTVSSAGDFNGDGKDDVIVGAPQDDNNSTNNSGSAFIFFGGITGTKRADADADVILNGQSASDRFGRAVSSAGDFNGDGKDDVIVGARYDDNNSENSSGSAFIFFGGITGTKRADAEADVILDGQSTGDLFGHPVASGDFNGDGVSDVIVGASEDDNNSEADSGSAFIFFANVGHSLFPSSIGRADDTRYSSRLVISPYAQAIPNDSYTFIGVTHPSLDTALTQIGLVVEVIDMTTTVNTPAGRAAMFTVDAGETHRVFVVNQGHPKINKINPALTDSRTHIINTVDSAQFGQVRVTTVSERPALIPRMRAVKVGDNYKFDNLGQLSFWGTIYMESTGSGFPMEFIGDMHDSSPGGETKPSSWTSVNRSKSVGYRTTLGGNGQNKSLNFQNPRRGRGIN